jgi:hypothetical protein
MCETPYEKQLKSIWRHGSRGTLLIQQVQDVSSTTVLPKKKKKEMGAGV